MLLQNTDVYMIWYLDYLTNIFDVRFNNSTNNCTSSTAYIFFNGKSEYFEVFHLFHLFSLDCFCLDFFILKYLFIFVHLLFSWKGIVIPFPSFSLFFSEKAKKKEKNPEKEKKPGTLYHSLLTFDSKKYFSHFFTCFLNAFFYYFPLYFHSQLFEVNKYGSGDEQHKSSRQIMIITGRFV